ncbi:MAG: phosphoenolpyruvate--protein phosphotransferase [Caulobacteraceae bacterium]
MTTIVLGAPLEGWALPIEETPDPVFAERMLGDGIAIDPTLGELRAPCAGEIVNLNQAGHALTLRGESGVEILLHIGIETVAMKGRGFEREVEPRQTVQAGQLLVRFDLDAVAPSARSLISPVVITNGEAFAIERAVSGRPVRSGEPVIWLRRVGEESGQEADASEAQARRTVKVGLEHGLHARPAALLARRAAAFSSSIGLRIRGERADARSAVSMMTLRIERGDEIEIETSGADAQAALDAVAGLLASGRQPDASPKRETPLAAKAPARTGELTGVCASPGLGIGPIHRLVEAEPAIGPSSGDPVVERTRLATALAEVRADLEARLGGAAGGIIEAHLTFLCDPEIAAAAEAAIASGASAGTAWRDAVEGAAGRLRALGPGRMAERAGDLRDIERQVLLKLSGESGGAVAAPKGSIVVADDILPSEFLALEPAGLAGLAMSRGGPTSHVAILAQSMGLPAVVALGPGALDLEGGVLAILDADAALLKVDPDVAGLEAARVRLEARRRRRERAQAAAGLPCRTADGIRIEVFANLGSPSEAPGAVEAGAEGCGLLRTEFLFMERRSAPGEAEQAAAYQAIADALAGRPLNIRTLDVGGDKPVAYLAQEVEPNPALGVRGLRASLAAPELFETQVRAILKVRPAPRIMLPMVASLAELEAARVIISELLDGAPMPEVGAMVETPAAAVTADILADVADFLSIGSNDLAQYALAMDRTNPHLARQVDALHPAVLRLIDTAARGAASRGRPVAVCGGLASDPFAAPILVGLGVSELSAAPAAVPDIKAAVAKVSLEACRDIARRALKARSAAEVRALRLNEPAAKKRARPKVGVGAKR